MLLRVQVEALSNDGNYRKAGTKYENVGFLKEHICDVNDLVNQCCGDLIEEVEAFAHAPWHLTSPVKVLTAPKQQKPQGIFYLQPDAFPTI